ncbi:MAG: protein kinase domain-containing protein, partial [Planctomycetaceae bacterium]
MVSRIGHSPPQGQLSLAEAIDSVCEAFEAAWQGDARPELDAFVERVSEPGRAELLIELVALEVVYRRQRGERPALSDYASRYPEALGRLAREIEWPSDSERCSVGSTVPEESNTPAGPPAGPAAALDPLRPADHMGRYHLIERVGRGGFGEVWRGFDPQLKRTVAIKVPRIDRHGPGSVDEFLREGRKLAALRHPGIVAVYDVGEAAGRCFIVSEFVEGGTLED